MKNHYKIQVKYLQYSKKKLIIFFLEKYKKIKHFQAWDSLIISLIILYEIM